MSQNKIPTSKVARASQFVATGAKIGLNYARHYANKMVTGEADTSTLNQRNAKDIYQTLSTLKGSALKMAQMLATDKNLLPTEYFDAFRQSQYKAPALSGPLITQVFRKSLGVTPQACFDFFDLEATNAASIGQVHRAEKDGKPLAVKIQYPGIAESIVSDLRLVKPFAVRLLDLNESEIRPYFEEVEAKLLEEADYVLELKQSMAISQACQHLPGLVFPVYYPAFSGSRVLTMDWLEGTTLTEWVQSAHDQDTRNQIGQWLWDFYDFQMHQLRQVHADPHPGNFLVTPDGKLGVLDFGCVKSVPQDFYEAYFSMLDPNNLLSDEVMEHTLTGLGILLPTSGKDEKAYFISSFRQLLELLRQPFDQETFDFGDAAFFTALNDLGERLAKDPRSRSYGAARGSRHIIYVNKTYFGLFNMLHLIGAKVSAGKVMVG